MRGKLFMAIGAGAMYYLDPQQGRTRRARARDRIVTARRRFDGRAEDAALTAAAAYGIADPVDATVDPTVDAVGVRYSTVDIVR